MGVFILFSSALALEEGAHHLLVFFLRDGLPGVSVEFIHILCAMVNHLLHGAIPIKFAFVVAIFAVVETSGAVGMGGTLVVGSERHATTLAKLWQKCDGRRGVLIVCS